MLNINLHNITNYVDRRLGTVDIGTVRICCSVYNTRADADKLIAGVKKCILGVIF